MHTYVVNMESGHTYWVVASNPYRAEMQAEEMAAKVHGEVDHAIDAVLAEG